MEKQEIRQVNGAIESVTVAATYNDSRKLPRLGQRRKFGSNGNAKTLVLHSISAERIGSYDEEERLSWEFTTKEVWGGYYDF